MQAAEKKQAASKIVRDGNTKTVRVVSEALLWQFSNQHFVCQSLYA